MTQDEANKLMGDAAAELVSVRKRLGCLETKAEGFRRILLQAASALTDSLSTTDKGAVVPEPEVWPSTEEIDALCIAINEARTRRHQLTERLREWGVIE